ncbi:hypothetical protein EMIT0215P_90119 [Pseudomonas serboccidentalis]
MFITRKPAEIFLSAYLGDDSTQYWQYVEQTTHCPWFYVRVGRQQGGEALTSMVMLPSISALEKLLNGKRMAITPCNQLHFYWWRF